MSKKLGIILFSIWMLAIVAFVSYKGILPAWQEGPSDFSNYYVSSSLLVQGESISDFYNNDWFADKAINVGVDEGAKFAPFPPATAFLYLPLTVLPPLQAKRIWLVCNLLFIGILVFQLKSISSLSLFEISLILSLFCIPIASNIRLGQSYLFFTILLIQFLKAIKEKKYFLGGGLLGFASSLKYFPIVYFLYALPKLKKKILVGLFSSIIVLCSLPILVNGLSTYQAFFAEFWNHLNGNLSGQGQFSYTFQSIDALLANLFVYDAELNPNAVSDSPSLKGIIKLIFTALVLFFSVKAFKRGTQKTKNLTVAACIVASSLLIPASASYHLLLLFPAIVLVLNFLRKQENSTMEIGIVLLLTLVSCTILPHHIPELGFSSTLNTLIHFPRLYGLIALCSFLFMIQNRHLQTHG